MDEAAQSLASIFRLFKERYGIGDYRELYLNVTLVNDSGEDVELVDANTSDVLDVFEVYKTQEDVQPDKKKPNLRLVVDNTRK